jgi:hypothetical protein
MYRKIYRPIPRVVGFVEERNRFKVVFTAKIKHQREKVSRKSLRSYNARPAKANFRKIFLVDEKQ